MKPLSLTILPTRKCNLNCSYCNIHDQHFPNELSWDQWVVYLKKLTKQIPSICFTVMLGGDVTTWGDDLVKFVGATAGMPLGFTSNGLLLTEDYLKELKKNGLDSVSVSLDTLKNRKDTNENIKSQRTIQLLPLLNKLGFKDLHCTVTVDNTNLEEVPAIIRYLTGMKTYAEITPMLFGKSKAYDYTSSYEALKDRLFTFADQDRVDRVMAEVIRMKNEGYLIHNTDEFLRRWSYLGVEQNWMCEYPTGLTADADGSMRLCLQIKGDRVTKHNIGSLDFEAFLKDWKLDYKEMCRGCFWNCAWEPKYIYEKTGGIEAVQQYFNHGVKKIGL